MPAAERDAARADTYLNPVHARDFPDPYVLKFAGEYFAYCTGFWRDGRAFGVMRSRDLVGWEELAGALEPLPGGHPCYWAPEVYYREGKFLMYYSVGNETLMHVRVAVAERPDGPFVDSGRRLTREEFAIDPHAFTDADGSRYLFYATDFLTHTHVGTGTVVDRLIDDFTPEGRPRPVTRARYDWQVYDPARREKGGVRWHTVEGPFVLARKGRYYEMFSGGNWQNVSYGVSYATSDRVLRDDEWGQHADGEKVLPVLRTIPGKVIGPGHNSVVRGGDNFQLFCVYHRWAEGGRVLAIDRMEFVGDALAVLGPSTTPQPAPGGPWLSDYFEEPRAEGLGGEWECLSGRWSVGDGEARQAATAGMAEARCEAGARGFVAEVYARALGEEAGGSFGLCLAWGASRRARMRIVPGAGRAVVDLWGGGAWAEADARSLPEAFARGAFHLLRAEADGDFLRFTLDDLIAFGLSVGASSGGGDAATPRLSLLADDCAAAFKGFTLARGFADDFDEEGASRARGWTFERAAAEPRGEVEGAFTGRRLRLPPLVAAGRETDAVAAGAHEMIVSLKVEVDEAGAGRSELWAITPGAALPSGEALNFCLRGVGEGGYALSVNGSGGADERLLALPRGFDPFAFQQFRFRRESGRLRVTCGAEVIGEVDAPASGARVGVAAGGVAAVSVDQVRVTAVKRG